MNLEELEQEIRMHRRARRKELLVMVGIGAVLFVLLAGLLVILL